MPNWELLNGQSKAETRGTNINQIIDNLEAQFPGVKSRLCDEKGQIKRYVNVFVNDKEIRTLQGTETPVADSDELSIVPAMAGGKL